MARLLTFLVLLLSTSFSAPAAVASPAPDPTFPDVQYCTSTSGVCNGTVRFNCPVNVFSGLDSNAWDPIAHWGMNPSPHAHSELGSTAFGPNTTLSSQLSASTSCVVQSNHDMMYWPTVYNADGTEATVNNVGYYIGTKQYLDPAKINGPLLDGLRFAAGTPECSVSSCARKDFFCDKPNGAESNAFKHIPTVAECNATGDVGGGYTITYGSNPPGDGSCWNPAHGYGEGFGGSGGAADLIYASPCPAGYEAVPTPALVIRIWSSAAENYGLGGYLSSDNGGSNPSRCLTGISPDTSDDCGSSGHFDFSFGFTNDTLDGDDAMTDMVNECFDVTNQNPNTALTCNTAAANGVLNPIVAGNVTNFNEAVTN